MSCLCSTHAPAAPAGPFRGFSVFCAAGRALVKAVGCPPKDVACVVSAKERTRLASAAGACVGS